MIDPPDERWLPFLKCFCGVLMICSLVGLALAIGLGKVEETTSYGLKEIVTGLLVLSGSFAQWAFGSSKDK